MPYIVECFITRIVSCTFFLKQVQRHVNFTHAVKVILLYSSPPHSYFSTNTALQLKVDFPECFLLADIPSTSGKPKQSFTMSAYFSLYDNSSKYPSSVILSPSFLFAR